MFVLVVLVGLVVQKKEILVVQKKGALVVQKKEILVVQKKGALVVQKKEILVVQKIHVSYLNNILKLNKKYQ
jgi:hypothetical protein